MGGLTEFFKGLWDKFKNASRTAKIALGIGAFGIIIAAVLLTISVNSTKYAVLFSNLDSNDSKTIVDQLKTMKVSNYKVSGNSILVPEAQVDELRLELVPQLSDGSKGWELFDTSNQFGSTDEEMQVKYQRALQGELEKTIKSFPQIDKAKVTLVLPQDSVFVKDSTPASASVTLIMKSGQTLKDDQVKAIIALVSGSVRNLPKENIQVVDDKMKLLSKGLFDKNNIDTSTATDEQQQMKKDYEKYLEDKVMSMLGLAYKDKVAVTVNADLNFDADKLVSTTYDPKGTVVSEHKVLSGTNQDSTRTSQSPVDNNMVNTSVDTSVPNNNGTNNSDITTNYEISKKEQEVVKAPGSVNRITASVIIDGNLDDATRSSIKNLVASAIGVDEKRGDMVSIEGLSFDTSSKDDAKKTVDAMKAEAAQEARMNLYKLIALSVGGLAVLIVLVSLFRRKNKGNAGQLEFAGADGVSTLDVMIGDDNLSSPHIEYKPIDFEHQANSERAHIEKEIKKYASDKPEQVIDIIKSWLAEDER